MNQLHGVSETLLIPLYARWLETKRPDAIVRDERALEICNSGELDFSRFSNMALMQLAIAIRSEIIDEETKAFLRKRPGAVVVNLGAGLCTRFFRVDDGTVRWIDVDLTAVAPLWRRFIGGTDRHRFIEASVLEPSWLERIEPLRDGRMLFIAEGLLMYFDKEQVKALLSRIAQAQPGAEMLAEALGPRIARHSGLLPAVSKTSARFKWGVRSFAEVERWDIGVTMLDEWHYLNHHPERWGPLRVIGKLPFVRDEAKVARLLLGALADERNHGARV